MKLFVITVPTSKPKENLVSLNLLQTFYSGWASVQLSKDALVFEIRIDFETSGLFTLG